MDEFSRCGKLLCGVAIGLASLSARVEAAEVILKNDSVTGTGDGTPCLCLVPSEIAASWLTVPFDGTLVGVQVFWQSQAGGATEFLEAGVHIYAGATFPTPGATLASVTGPTLSDGVLNEYRHTDPPSNTIPINVAVTAGQTIVVGVEMFNPSSGGDIFTPSTSYDQDGCQASRNAVRLESGSWVNFCDQGAGLGDWAIRAIVVPDNDIPAVSQWGVVLLALAILIAGTAVTTKQRVAKAFSNYPTHDE